MLAKTTLGCWLCWLGVGRRGITTADPRPARRRSRREGTWCRILGRPVDSPIDPRTGRSRRRSRRLVRRRSPRRARRPRRRTCQCINHTAANLRLTDCSTHRPLPTPGPTPEPSPGPSETCGRVRRQNIAEHSYICGLFALEIHAAVASQSVSPTDSIGLRRR